MEHICSISLDLRTAEYSFITNMANQCKSKEGTEVSPEGVMRAMVRLLQRLEVDVSGARTEDQLMDRLQNAVQGN